MFKQLQSTSQAGCTDARDRIYCLLSMYAQEVAARIKSNSTISYTEVYLDFFKSVTEEYRSLIMLQHCDLHSRSLSGPTWVPDWSRAPKRAWQYLHATVLTDARVYISTDSGTMNVLGVRIAQVTDVSGSL